MDEQFKQFVRDVEQKYNFSESRVDGDYNIIMSLNGRSFMIGVDNIMKYYKAFQGSSLPYLERVTRTVGYITHLTEKWYNNWK